AQVLAKQIVEQAVERAGVVVAVPPEPVRALGNVDLLPGLGECRRVMPARALLGEQELARDMQFVPAAVVLGMTDPDGEILADPAPGEEPLQRLPWWMLGEELADADRANPGVAHDLLVHRAEEPDAPVGVILPAVLAVEDDRDDRCRVVPAGRADGQHLAE